TPEIGPIRNKEILDNFVATIANDDSFKFKIDGTVNVSKKVYNVVDDKEGEIDLLITNNYDQAIIIENKINDAPDMENQLVRYMKYVQEQEFGEPIPLEEFKKNVRVVYLTLIPNGKRPNIDDYAPSFSPYTKLLEDAKNGQDGDILKYRSAVDSDNTKDDLVKFLQKCINGLADKCSLKKIYLEQYQTLLKHLGGKAKMSELGNKVIEKIYSDPTLLQAAKVLYEILEPNKGTSPKVIDKYINNILFPLLKNNMDFKDYKDITNKTYPVVWARTKKHFLYACAEHWNLEIGFGHHNQEFNKNDISKYKQILSQSIPSEAPQEDKKNWVYVRIEPITKNGPMQKFLESYKGKIEEIKNAFLDT
ncbi:MAG: PD-(D/E)XK nuclease family protein, partial [Treponema sp.]|nr:PD-(D/E)XK nuclease family protein [Treponema sp.]